MKFFCLLIALMLHSAIAGAQKPANFTYTLDDGTDIPVETVNATGKHSSLLVYFPGKSPASDSINAAFRKFSAGENVTVLILHIPAENIADSSADRHRHYIAENLARMFLPSQQKELKISPGNVIIAGSNEGAVTVFYCASAAPAKIKRTAMFFSGFDPFLSLKNENDSAAFGFSGKLFVYNKKERTEDISADEFCETLALKADVLLYKMDVETEEISPDLFNECYHWLMAEGSNYVFKID